MALGDSAEVLPSAEAVALYQGQRAQKWKEARHREQEHDPTVRLMWVQILLPAYQLCDLGQVI